MAEYVILLSIPGLREQDLAAMPNLRALTAGGGQVQIVPSFPAVTCPVQANMTTGKTPREHGVIASGLFRRDRGEVEMWTAWNECITAPQIWDVLHHHNPETKSAVWFPLHSKGAGADYICTPAPIPNPDGSESLWCYTKPLEMYGELRDVLDHFPLKHFWGPLADIKSTAWIIDSAVHAAKKNRPNFFYLYLPHLDYAGQRTGPDSAEAQQAVMQLDEVLGRLIAGFGEAYGTMGSGGTAPLWLVASEYTIVPVDHVLYPNCVLREAGLITLQEIDGAEQLDVAESQAWALVDHQFSHVFVKDRDSATITKVAELFAGREGIDEVLIGPDREQYDLDHERSGDVILISSPSSWQAYYWWLDDVKAPPYARTVDIHNKPGYDPAELHLDLATGGISLDATRVKGSHGAPANEDRQRGIILSSQPGVFEGPPMADTDVFELVLRQFGI